MSDDPDIEEVQRQLVFEYCWMRNKLGERINDLVEVINEATVATLPYHSNQKIVEVITRMRKLVDTANRYWQWDDQDAARKTCSQIDGAIAELRSIMKQQNLLPQFVQRVLS